MRTAVIVILLVLSACFSASETAYTSLSLIQKKKLEQGRKLSHRVAYRLCQNPQALITTILVGNNIVNLSVSSLVTAMVIEAYGNAYVAFGTGILTLVVLVFGEIVPKQTALSLNMKIACLTAVPLLFFETVLFPVVRLFEYLMQAVTRLFERDKSGDLSVDALFDVIDVAKDEGVVDPYEQALVQRVLHFNETTVKAIMTHRTDVFSVPSDVPLQDVFGRIVDSGYSRIPVYDGTPENIVGVLLVREILRDIVEKKMQTPVGKLMLKADYIPESMKVDELFRHFKQSKLQIAVVLDEYGGLAGVVSMEDVVEQLLGELYDEHESGQAERIVSIDPEGGSYTVLCEVSFREFLDQMGIKSDNAEGYSTLASYILDIAGHIPSEGEEIRTPLGTFTLTGVSGHRMERARFTPASIE